MATDHISNHVTTYHIVKKIAEAFSKKSAYNGFFIDFAINRLFSVNFH
jgi:hypothetical protein